MPITNQLPLAHVLAVANSYHEPEARDIGSSDGAHWIPAHDHLETPEAASEFLARMGIRLGGRPDRRHLARLRRIREAARSLLGSPEAYAREVSGLLAHCRYQLDPVGQLKAIEEGWDGLTVELTASLIELRDQAPRLKMCANDQCHWLFLDESKNHSRQWCGAATCGNRERVRRFRSRHEAR